MTCHPLPGDLVPGDTVVDAGGERTVASIIHGSALTTVHFTDLTTAMYRSGEPVTRGRLASHLLSAHHVAVVPRAAEAEHLHRVLHTTQLIRTSHDHEGASL